MSVDYANLTGLGDFATLTSWDLEFIQAPAGVNVPTDFNARILSSDVPKRDAGETIPVRIRGLPPINQPGLEKFIDTFNFTMAETSDLVAIKMINQWRQLCFNTTTGAQTEMSAVKAILKLTMLNRQKQPVYAIRASGCFIVDHDPTGSQLDGETSDILRPNITLSIDQVSEVSL